MQIRTGSASITGSPQTNVVTGHDVDWSTVVAGDLFSIVGDGVTYDIAAVGSPATTLTLTVNYAGTNKSAEDYVIFRDFTERWELPIPNKKDIETATLLKKALTIIDGVLGGAQSGEQFPDDPFIGQFFLLGTGSPLSYNLYIHKGGSPDWFDLEA